MAIKGIALKHQNKGKHIVVSNFEHSSVYGALDYLKTLGFEITYLDNDENGLITIENIQNAVRKDTILVIINQVNSETGLKQPVEEIGKFLKENYNCYFFVDLTQSVGKIKTDLSYIDLATFSAHKIYGLKGISCLIKKDGIVIEPLIHGGKSTTAYRSGTPAHPLIVSISKALRLATLDLDNKYNHIKMLNDYLKVNLKKYNDVYLNSNEYCIPHILNISVVGIKAETFMHALEKYDIYVSTKSACSDEDALSESVLALTHDKEKARSSIRISLSYLTTKEEIDKFLEAFANCYQQLKLNK